MRPRPVFLIFISVFLWPPDPAVGVYTFCFADVFFVERLRYLADAALYFRELFYKMVILLCNLQMLFWIN